MLGRSLLVRVGELMHTGDELPVVSDRLTLRESLPEIVGKRLGGTCVVDDDGRLVGLCVDGDVKRVLLEREDALDRPITEAMNPGPDDHRSADTAGPDRPAHMEERPSGPVTLLIVIDDGRDARWAAAHPRRPAGRACSERIVWPYPCAELRSNGTDCA